MRLKGRCCLKILTMVLTVILLCSQATVLSSAAAQAAKVENVDGERCVFVGAFGKVTYNKKQYASFKKFSEAIKALGKDGGKIILYGFCEAGDFNDTPGRAKITITGASDNVGDCCFVVTKTDGINFLGDTEFSNLSLKIAEDIPIYTNGYKFEACDNVQVYKTQIVGGEWIYTYPLTLTPGTAGTESKLAFSEGIFKTVALGAIDNNSAGNAELYVSGGTYENIVSGVSGIGTYKGNTRAVIKNADVQNLVAGSRGGSMTGNSVVEFKSGNIGKITVDSEYVSGTVVLEISGGEISDKAIGGFSGNGKNVVIVNNIDGITADIDSSFSYFINVKNGKARAVFGSDGVLQGFDISDIFGKRDVKVSVNGNETSSENGLFVLEPGYYNIEVETDISLKVNDSADFVKGYDDGTFKPDTTISRAEAITLLTRIVEDENKIVGKINSEYTDVNKEDWYNPYIGFFENLGYLEKLSSVMDTKISPKENITRSEFVYILYNISDKTYDKASKLISFSDVVENRFSKEICYMASNGYIEGYDDGTFRPDKTITRAEVVTIANRFLNRVPSENANAAFSDISSHWAKNQIAAACGKEGSDYTKKTGNSEKYSVTGSSAEDYIKNLHEKSGDLSGEEILSATDIISEKMKSDIVNSENTDYKIKGKTYYIANDGSNDNNGLSQEKPFKTIDAVRNLLNPGDAVLFKRGDVFRNVFIWSGAGNGNMMKGITYGAYGEGEKPVLMQSKENYAKSAYWEATDVKNVYKLTKKLKNVGVVVFDNDIYAHDPNAKYGYIMNKDAFGFDGYKDLNSDLQFYSDYDEGDFYLYSAEGNPGSRFSDIEIGEGQNIFTGQAQDLVIDNISFMYTGQHAVGLNNSQNVAVTNCIFSWIGGSILSWDRNAKNVVNYGNAVEVYVSCDGLTVENNWMYQIYDTGITVQYWGGEEVSKQKDIEYKRNLIEYVHWGIEYVNITRTGFTKNMHVAYNVFRYGGYGWGSIVRFRESVSQLYSGNMCGITQENENIVAEYNIFGPAKGYVAVIPRNSNEIDNANIYIQKLGGTFAWVKDETIYSTYDAATEVVKYIGDKNAVVVIFEEEN